MTADTRLPWMHRAGDYPTTNTEYFELLTRAVMSAGLGPRLVEARWAGIRVAFCDFDIEVVADMTPADGDRLMSESAPPRRPCSSSPAATAPRPCRSTRKDSRP